LVEPAIFFLVGFLTAALAALLVAPAISRRARRLAFARARLQSPLSETQARADRDALRGQHAVELMRLEARLRAVEDDRAIHRVELGRQASRIVAIEDLSAERAAEIDRQRAELTALHSEARDMNVQLATQEMVLHDLTSQRDSANRSVTVAQSRILALEVLVDENRATVASLNAQATNAQLELSNLRRTAAASESERARLSAALAERMDAASRLTDELAAANARFVSLTHEYEGRSAEAAQSRTRLEDLEPRLARSEAAREQIVLESSRQLALVAERDAALQKAQIEHHELTLRMTMMTETASAKQDALAAQIQALTTSQATMEGALRVVRSDRADLQREIERLRARLAESMSSQPGAKTDQALRQSIARLGREIARGHEEPKENEPVAAQIVNFTRREPTSTGGFPPESSTGAALRQDEPVASER
jgi:predicted  nucleic acid-binding Zn-ribbon protein